MSEWALTVSTFTIHLSPLADIRSMPFVHLHTHSEYSLLDGANRIPELVAHVKKLGMDSLAVTDHGNMHAAWSFYEEARAQDIRPILGFEAYLAFGPRQAREALMGSRRVQPPRAPGNQPDRLQEPRAAHLDRLHGRILSTSANRPGSAGASLRGHHLPCGVPLG